MKLLGNFSPTSNTDSHDCHEKSNSWFTIFSYQCRTPRNAKELRYKLKAKLCVKVAQGGCEKHHISNIYTVQGNFFVF